MDIPVEFVVCLIALLVIAAFSAVLFNKIAFPFTIGLVAVGVGLGFVVTNVHALAMLGEFKITPNILLYVLLPALLFDAALNMEVSLLKKNLVPILTLAAPGLIIATFITAGFVMWLTPLAFLPALAFGALISTTDPVAVISLFKEVGAPKRLVMLVDGESLFNDATAIVAFLVVMGLVSGGVLTTGSFMKAGFDFTYVFAGGFVIGAVLGWVIIKLLSVAKGDPFLEMTFTTVAAYFSFVLAQFYLELSGVMAVVGTGMVIAYYSVSHYSAEGRKYMKMFWSFASFVTNSLIFLMLGITESNRIMTEGLRWDALTNAGIAILGVLIARGVVVFGLIPLLNKLPKAHKINFANQTIIFWGGLRGALPMGLAISLTADAFGPGSEAIRNTIIDMTFGVVLFTLLVQGTTVKWLIKRLGLDKPSKTELAARAYGTTVAKENASKAIEKLQAEWCLTDKASIDSRLSSLLSEGNDAKAKLSDMLKAHDASETEVRNMVLWLQAAAISKQFASRLYDRGFISEGTMRNFQMNCESAVDDIMEFNYPPADLEKRPSSPLLLKMKEFFLYMTGKCIPHLKLNVNLVSRQLRRNFEWHSLIVETALMIDSELPDIAQLCGAGDAEVAKCRTYYKKILDYSRNELMVLKVLFPEPVEMLVNKTLDKVSAIAEYHSIEKLSETGGLPEETAVYLLGNIKARLR